MVQVYKTVWKKALKPLRFSSVKIRLLPRLTYKCNTVPIKIPKGLFIWTRKIWRKRSCVCVLGGGDLVKPDMRVEL